jgi:phosphoenolpyruvate-protein kinase (PTS system EI component)
MCGDMAGDPLLVWMLMGIGLRNFSMAPRQIPVMKSIIHSTRLTDAERLASAASRLCTEAEVENLVYGTMRERFPLELSDEEGN